MAAMGCPYKGVLYVGVMMTEEGPKVLEFNVRLGDPEAQVVLPRLESDLVEIVNAVAHDRLSGVEVKWSGDASMAVVLASGGYPGKYRTGFAISGLDSLDEETLAFHAGTFYDEGSKELKTSGGRVLSVVGRGRSWKRLGYGRMTTWEGWGSRGANIKRTLASLVRPYRQESEMPLVGIVMGSPSDEPYAKETTGILDKLGISYELNFISAHRTPEKAREYGITARGAGAGGDYRGGRNGGAPAGCDGQLDHAPDYRGAAAGERP